MQNLNVSLIQIPLAWQQPELNRETFAKHIDGLVSTDLILLPEMFNTGFSMEAEKLAETMDGPTVQWMAEMARKSQAVVTGSLIIEAEQGYFNRLVWMRPNGSFDTYDKRHLFRLAKEQDYYQAGKTNQIFELKGWRIQPQICYDLRFPVWSRNTQAYDLLLYVANWPAKRRYAWQTLLRARAIENICYVAAVNRIGEDGNGFDHAGDSAVLNFMGEEIIHQAEDELIASIELDKNLLDKFRTRFPAQMDGDSFVLQDHVPTAE
jgi:predicted amidohydrolase